MRHAGLVLFLTLGFLALGLGTGCSDGPSATPRDSGSSPEAGASSSGAAGPDQTRGSGPGSTALPRVVFLGTSLTAGYGLDDPARQAWVSRIDALADSSGLPVEAVNAGSSGDTSSGGLRRLEWILQEPLDLLVVELGANDGLRGQDVTALADNLRAIVNRTRAAYPEARVALVAMEAPRNMGPDYVERFRRVFPEVARETGSTLVPFPLDSVAGRPELNLPDGIHPTPRGHQVMARAMWPHLLPLLRDLSPRGQESAATATPDTLLPGDER